MKCFGTRQNGGCPQLSFVDNNVNFTEVYTTDYNIKIF